MERRYEEDQMLRDTRSFCCGDRITAGRLLSRAVCGFCDQAGTIGFGPGEYFSIACHFFFRFSHVGVGVIETVSLPIPARVS